MTIVTDTVHGILDYITVALFVLAPSLFGFVGTALLMYYALAAIHLTMTLLTDMPLGVINIIPMKLHSIVEMIVGPVHLITGGQWFLVAAGAVIFVVWILSEYNSGTKFDVRFQKSVK